METERGIRSKKKDLKPIRTKTAHHGEEDGDGHVNNHDHELVDEEPLSPSARLFHEPNFNVYIIAIMGSKTQIRTDIVRANLVQTLLKQPRFSSLQVWKITST